jgi:cytochrome c biogenesis protein CcmG, thiol:disulfide interchange protein DsbE
MAVNDQVAVSAQRKKRIAPFIAAAVGVVVVAFLVVLAVSSPTESTVSSSPLLGRPAPEVQSTTLENEQFDLARRRGSWVVFNFFNSTCVPCRQEHPYLLSFYDNQETAATPAELYTIVNDDTDGAVQAYFEANRGDWTKVRDDDGAIAVAFGVAKVPETWIIDPNGFVRLRIIGALSENFLDDQLLRLQQQFEGAQ